MGVELNTLYTAYNGRCTTAKFNNTLKFRQYATFMINGSYHLYFVWPGHEHHLIEHSFPGDSYISIDFDYSENVSSVIFELTETRITT